jgi:hypothetical protein
MGMWNLNNLQGLESEENTISMILVNLRSCFRSKQQDKMSYEFMMSAAVINDRRGSGRRRWSVAFIVKTALGKHPSTFCFFSQVAFQCSYL